MKCIKNNKILFLTLFILLGFSIAGIYNNIKEFNMRVYAHEYKINECKNNMKNESELLAWCKEYIKWDGPKRSDAFFTFFDIIFDNHFRIIHLLLPILIIMCSINRINIKLTNGYIKNELIRKKYSIYMLKEWLLSISHLLIIPLLFVFIFVVSFILTGNIDYKNSMLNFDPWVNPIFFNNIILSIVIYFINFLLHGIFIINIGYIMTKKGKGYILSVISSFIVYLGLWLFSETFFGYFIMIGIFGKPELHNYFSFTSLWGYPLINNFMIFTLIQFSYALISSIIVYIIYKNKEEVIMANEK
jgi:hypothetical protein